MQIWSKTPLSRVWREWVLNLRIGAIVCRVPFHFVVFSVSAVGCLRILSVLAMNPRWSPALIQHQVLDFVADLLHRLVCIWIHMTGHPGDADNDQHPDFQKARATVRQTMLRNNITN
jgi:hypothetical protein